MKKVVLSVFAFAAILSSANAQDTKKVDNGILAKADEKKADGWVKGGVIGLNFSQVALSNWAGGGQNTIAGTSLVSLFANYKKGKKAWDNSLDLAYGITSLDDGPYFKSDDRIELNSKYGQQLKEDSKWYYGALLNFRSQFAEGFASVGDTVAISKFMSPGYLTFALGFDYKPSDNFSVFLSPVSSKTTFVMDNDLSAIGAYGVDSNSNVRFELGGLIQAKYQKDIMENVNLKTQLQLFSNYLDRPENIDVFWETLISMKVNKYITASISTTLIYDHDVDIAVDRNNDGINDGVGPRLQFKEAFNLGFSYKF
jgi:hypothetical protein